MDSLRRLRTWRSYGHERRRSEGLGTRRWRVVRGLRWHGNTLEQGQPYYAFKELNTLCVERDSYKVYGAPVRAYWNKVEGQVFKNMAQLLDETSKLDAAEAAQRITAYCNQVQEQAFKDAKKILNDVRWYKSQNSNTLKNGRNPETHEVIDQLKEIDPLELTLDASGYEL